MRFFFLFLFSLQLTFAAAQSSEFNKLKDNFYAAYAAMNVPGLQISYKDNLAGIQSRESLQQQEDLLLKLKQDLSTIQPDNLQEKEAVEYKVLVYFAELHLDRVEREQAYLQAKQDSIAGDKIFDEPLGKEWYVHFLRRWLDSSISVDSLYTFGLREIEEAKAIMREIQQRSGYDEAEFKDYINSSAFDVNEPDSVQMLFEGYADRVRPMLEAHFPRVKEISRAAIVRGTDERLAQVPGFYRNNTFYYNIFDKPFNRREISYLFLHEAVPGHHYEISHRRLSDLLTANDYFRNACYGEGWAAYIEELSYELGLYEDIYQELGHREWDLIRSVRVVLDIELNYKGMSDEAALDFWRKHIKDKDDIGRREIARMKRWPAQVITYKYGGDKIMQWKEHFEKMPDFSLMKFHEKVLQYGPMPFTVLEELMLNNR